MKKVTLLAKVNTELCIGCKICEKICPVLAIKVVKGKAQVKDEDCRGCSNCAERCPKFAVKMAKRETPFEVGMDLSKFDPEKIKELCLKAHLNPEQTICYCVGTRAEEVAAAILSGAKTPEEISLMTGVRTGCTIECVQPLLRMIQAAGIELKPVEGGWQWYGTTVTAWDIPDEIKEKYNSRGFYFDEDRELLDEVAHKETDGCCKGGK